jgi:hypothetical protein
MRSKTGRRAFLSRAMVTVIDKLEGSPPPLSFSKPIETEPMLRPGWKCSGWVDQLSSSGQT